jgi:type IV secretory pathway VirB3-like protein
MTDIYFVALFMLSLSLIGSVIFLMQEMIADREKHFRESLLVMSMNNSAYQMSFFIG